MEHSIATHNGMITMRNPQTGNHRTIRIKTQAQDAKFKPGARIIGLLTGSDNESDYTNFGEVNPDGSIHVWYKKRGTVFERYADMITRADHWEQNKGIEYLFDTRCRRCNLRLTTPESVLNGIGPTCAGREL